MARTVAEARAAGVPTRLEVEAMLAGGCGSYRVAA